MSLTPKEQLIETIKKHNKILITFKHNYDYDTVASALALGLFLKKLKKQTDIICHDFVSTNKIKFLPAIQEIKQQSYLTNKFVVSIDLENNPLEEFSYDIQGNKLNLYIIPKNNKLDLNDFKLLEPEFKYDLIIVLDTTDLEQLGSLYDDNTDFFFKVPIINIDHLASNEEFGQINYVDLASTATSEIIADLIASFQPQENMIDENIATCLLTGIISKTNGFQNLQITPKALTTTSNLISLGARREEIIKNLFRTKSLATLKIWGKLLVNLKHDPVNRLVWSTIEQKDFEQTQAEPENIEEVVNDLIKSAPEAKIILIVYEKSKDVYNALVYSEKNINVMELTKALHPQGNKNSAKIELIEPSILIATEKIVTEIKNKLKEIPGNNI